MAHITYNATNGNFSSTQNVSANGNYVLYNNTQSGLSVNVVHDSDADYDVTLGPAEGQVYHAVTSGQITFTGVPTHTAVKATVAAEHTNNDGDRLATGSASLIFTPF